MQTWSCASAKAAGTLNYGKWCDEGFDRAMLAATVSAKPQPAWAGVMTSMAAWHPAIFLAAPVNAVAVHRRFSNVTIWPSKAWRSLWLWRVTPDMALPRDR
jgi:ABC-type transport system substrate-binding protein